MTIWVTKGLIDQQTADALLSEYDRRESSFSIGRVLMSLAAVLFSAAILLLIASNWEAIPRIARVAGIVSLIWIFYIGGAVCATKGLRGIAESLLVLATVSFGGAIALIGQMYHISGDGVQAMLVWFAGACIACLLFRSASLAVLAGFLSWAVAYAILMDGNWQLRPDTFNFVVPAMAVIVVALVRYADAGRGRHLAYILVLGWLAWLYAEIDEPWFALILAAVGLVLFLAASTPQSPLFRHAQESGAAPGFYSFALMVIGLSALHVDADNTIADVGISAATLIAAILGLVLAGRLNGAVRYFAYAVFAAETLYLSFETVGSIIGTSGFFLISGLFVALAAWLVIRLEKRFAPVTAREDVR